MDMDKTPKERVIYDESVYDEDFLRGYLEEDYENFKDDLEIDFDTYVTYKQDEGVLSDLMTRDFDEEIAVVERFFGERQWVVNPSWPDEKIFPVNPNNCNHILVRGSIGRWDGTRHGMTVFETFQDVLQGRDSPFGDCEIGKVWDENGSLFIHGYHHDGSVDVEIRQLTDAGEVVYGELGENELIYEPITLLDAHGTVAFPVFKTGDEAALFDFMWGNDVYSAAPRFMERVYGCPEKEWVQPEVTEIKSPEVETGRCTGKSTTPVCLSDVAKECRGASTALADNDKHDDRGQEAR